MDFTNSIPPVKEIERRVVILSIMDIDGNQFIKEGTSDNGHDVITWKNTGRTFLIDVDANRLFEWVEEACVDTDMSRLMRFCVNHQLHKRLGDMREKARKASKRGNPRKPRSGKSTTSEPQA